MLAASVDDEQVRTSTETCGTQDNVPLISDAPQVESELAEVKSQSKMIFRRLNKNSEQQASIESGQYTLQ